MNKEKFEEYIKDRYEDQTQWYGRRSRENKRLYVWFQWVVIVLSATIPVLVVMTDENNKWITAVFSVILAIATSGVKAFKFQENWLNYRTIAETLKKEKYFYSTGLFEYATIEDKERLFVERVERIISRENTLWISTQTRKDEENKD